MTKPTDLISYSVTDGTLKKMKEEFLPLRVTHINDKVGYEICHKAQMEVRSIRIEVENRRKELKADALEYGRKVDTEAKRITEELEAIENHLKAQKEIVDNEKKRLKEEEGKKAKEELDRRLSLLQAVKAPFSISEIALMAPEAFEAHYQAKKSEFEAEEKRRQEDRERLLKLEEEDKANKKKIADQEAENKRLKDEELARLKKDNDEKEAKLKEEKRVREENERKQKEEQDKRDEDERKRVADQKRKDDEAEAKRKKDEETAAKKIADDKLFEAIKKKFPTVEKAWVEIARLTKMTGGAK